MIGSYSQPDNLRFPRSMSEGRTPHIDLEPSGPVYEPWWKSLLAGIVMLVFIVTVVTFLFKVM